MSNKKNNQKRSSLIRLALGIVIIVFVNIISASLFTRIDLTAEKRYTISDEIHLPEYLRCYKKRIWDTVESFHRDLQ
jgi:ABC-type uncharacterized transport system involved in gliding motility auxiliary subunit